PLRQSGSEDDARLASKSLSVSSPESGLPEDDWAKAEAQQPKARVRDSNWVFMISSDLIQAWRRPLNLSLPSIEWLGREFAENLDSRRRNDHGPIGGKPR